MLLKPNQQTQLKIYNIIRNYYNHQLNILNINVTTIKLVIDCRSQLGCKITPCKPYGRNLIGPPLIFDTSVSAVYRFKFDLFRGFLDKYTFMEKQTNFFYIFPFTFLDRHL